MKSNKRKREIKKKKKQRKSKSSGSFGRATQEVLGGGLLENNRGLSIFPYLLFLTFLAFVYITNDYMVESKVRKISHLQKELRELRYEYVSVKSNLMSISKQSQLEKRLEHLGIKENNEPVKVIYINKSKQED